MSEDTILGMDLGTTFSAMAHIDRHGRPQIIANAEGRRTTPSAVYFDSSGAVVVGEQARNQALTQPSRTVQFIKREMGNPSFRLVIDSIEHFLEGISARILRKLREDAEAALG